MNNTNVAQVDEPVNPPSQPLPRWARRMASVTQLPMSAKEVAAANREKEKAAKAAAKAVQVAKDKASALAKKNAPSLSKLWADLQLKESIRPWFANFDHTSSSEVLYRWNGSYLQHIGVGEGAAIVSKWLDKHAPHQASTNNAMSCWAFGSARLRTERPSPLQDTNRNIIPCQGVYLEMDQDGTVRGIEPHPDHGMTYAVSIDPGTRPGDVHDIRPLPATSRFRQWLEAALPDAGVRALVQEQCGMTLLPGKNYSTAAWWYGEAGCGKSTLAEICKLMQRQTASTRLSTIGQRFGLESLIGASLVTIDEVDSNERWDEGMFKSLVSCNSVSVDRKNEKALVSCQLRACWIITSNPKPWAKDSSDGIWRRLCVVHWNVTIPQANQIANFHKVLMEEEGALILDWMLEGARSLIIRGRFMSEAERPQAAQDAKEESRNDADSVRAWVKDHRVSADPSVWKSKEVVFRTYLEWCEVVHQTPLDTRVFWRGLKAYVKYKEENRRCVGNKQARYVTVAWQGPKYE